MRSVRRRTIAMGLGETGAEYLTCTNGLKIISHKAFSPIMKIYFRINRESTDLVKENNVQRSMSKLPTYQVPLQVLFRIYVNSRLQ